MTAPAQDDFITIKEAAQILRCSVKTINRLVARRDLPSYKPTGRVLLRRRDVLALIRSTERAAV